MATIFWVEDQSHWIDKFSNILEATDFDGETTTVQVFRFAEAATQHIRLASQQEKPDIAILDANMNGNNDAGFAVSRTLRKKWPGLPVIYLSEHSGTDIEESAFENCAANDFIAKHQTNVEAVICWRIKSVLRQQNIQSKSPGSEKILQSGDLKIDLATWEIYWKGTRLMNPSNPRRPLSPTPRKVLRYLVESSPTPLGPYQMAEKLDTDRDRFSYDSYRQHIRILRRSFALAENRNESLNNHFLEHCKNGRYLTTFGDDGAYCWKPD